MYSLWWAHDYGGLKEWFMSLGPVSGFIGAKRIASELIEEGKAFRDPRGTEVSIHQGVFLVTSRERPGDPLWQFDVAFLLEEEPAKEDLVAA